MDQPLPFNLKSSALGYSSSSPAQAYTCFSPGVREVQLSEHKVLAVFERWWQILFILLEGLESGKQERKNSSFRHTIWGNSSSSSPRSCSLPNGGTWDPGSSLLCSSQTDRTKWRLNAVRDSLPSPETCCGIGSAWKRWPFG